MFSRLTRRLPRRVARDCAFSTARLPRVVILDATDATVEQRALGDTAEVIAAGARDAACRDVSDQMLAPRTCSACAHGPPRRRAARARAPLPARRALRRRLRPRRRRGGPRRARWRPNYGTEEVDAALSHVLNCYAAPRARRARRARRRGARPGPIAAARPRPSVRAARGACAARCSASSARPHRHGRRAARGAVPSASRSSTAVADAPTRRSASSVDFLCDLLARADS